MNFCPQISETKPTRKTALFTRQAHLSRKSFGSYESDNFISKYMFFADLDSADSPIVHSALTPHNSKKELLDFIESITSWQGGKTDSSVVENWKKLNENSPKFSGSYHCGVTLRQANDYGKRYEWIFIESSETSELETKFNALSNEWKSFAADCPSVAKITSHPAYLEIISFREKMIPFVLKDLEKEPNHWFIALYIMAGRFSPVRREDVGNIKKMIAAWLEWGRNNGKLR